ncbi:hypothetical protein ABT390_27805 [Streptomyces aurantiacus]|nr:hypothetical protein [Streptomyces aurantiacus]
MRINKWFKTTAMAAALGAAAVATASAPAAADVSAKFWDTKCNFGRACVYKLHGPEGRNWWNIEHCGYTPLNDYFTHAKAHGNSFRVYYNDNPNQWDYVAAGTDRPIGQGGDRASGVTVYC